MPDEPSLSVLMVSVVWPPETFIQSSITKLVEAGVDVHLAVSTRPGQARPRMENVRIVELPSWNLHPIARLMRLAATFLRKAIAFPRATARLARVLRAADAPSDAASRVRAWYRLLPFVGLTPDVVHFQWNSSAIDHKRLFDYFQRPTVVSCRGAQVQVARHNPTRSMRLTIGLKETLRRASVVHCVSEAMSQAAQTFGVAASRVVIIRPAVDTSLFRPAPPSRAAASKDCLRVATVGSLIWRKDMETALLAIRDLVEANVPVEFDIFGNGPEQQRLQYSIDDLGLRDVARLRGHVTPRECVIALQRADAFLLSSVSEGIANVVLEAMACGLPVVSTDCGGMREVIRDGVDGYIVPLRGHAEMAARLKTLAGDGDLRRRMGAAARQRVIDGFTLDKQTQLWMQTYAALRATGEQSAMPPSEPSHEESGVTGA